MIQESGRRPTIATINLRNLVYNFQSVKRFVGENLQYMAVVKADAYGHCAVECAKTFESAGIDCFGVALPEEGAQLRDAGIKLPIICLGGFWHGQEELLLEYKLTPVIYRSGMAEALNFSAKQKGVVAEIHVKIDTGMGRIGIRFDEVEKFVENLKRYKNLNLNGLMTHFSAADDLSQTDFTDLQIKRFYDSVKKFEENGFRPVYKDLANSPGAIAHENSRGNLVRLGGVLYGLGGDVIPANIPKPDLRAVLSLSTRVALLKTVPKGETLGYSRTFTTERDSIIATIPIGYHDGYCRAFSNRSRVIINNKYAPVVGRISMDWTLADVTEINDVKVNDEVILIGKQESAEIKAEELARLADTISYEITCGIGNRVQRIYKL